MRIVSLTPTATGIARALGLGPRIVGVGHADDASRPRRPRRVARPARRLEGLRSRTIHRAAVEAAAAGHSLIRVDAPALASLRPDLILLTEPDDPLGPDLAEIRAVVESCDPQPTLLVLEPSSVEGVLHAITTIGAHAEVEPAAMRLVARLRSRLGRIEHRVQLRREAGHRPPRVVVLEWLDPLRASGRWVPELVRRAGGWEVLGREGEPAAATTWRAVTEVDPELLFLAPRGFDTRAGAAEWARIRRPATWQRLEAVRRGQVVVLDSRLIAHPGPALLDGITVLAEVLDPEAFVDMASPTAWVPVD